MSSSPDTTTPTNIRLIHNQSASSVNTLPDAESPVQPALTPRAGSLAPASSPNSPMLPSRGSTGKLQRGVKKLLGISQTPNQQHPPRVAEDPLESGIPGREALFARMFRGSRKIRSFRRTKRRGIDKQYHSDDGYTSDPGLLRETVSQEDDDETDDVDTVEVSRRQNQIRTLERKIEKLRSTLPDDDGSEADMELLSQMEDKHHKLNVLKLSRPSVRTKRKKLENFETQLKLLQEGAPMESRRYSALRDRIGGGLKGMSLGLRGRLTFKRPKRFPGSSIDVIDDDEEEDDEALDEISQTAEGVLHVETEEFGNDSELLPVLKMKEEMEAMRQTSEEALLQNLNIRKEFDAQRARVEELKALLETVYVKLEQEKERAERLEGQVNDITELHQHEVGELRAQISQTEGMSMGKNQDLEDTMEAYHARLETLEVFVHRMVDNGEQPAISKIRKPITTIITFVLMVFTLFLKLLTFLKTKFGSFVLAVILLAILVYCGLNWYYQ